MTNGANSLVSTSLPRVSTSSCVADLHKCARDKLAAETMTMWKRSEHVDPTSFAEHAQRQPLCMRRFVSKRDMNTHAEELAMNLQEAATPTAGTDAKSQNKTGALAWLLEKSDQEQDWVGDGPSGGPKQLMQSTRSELFGQ